MGALQHVVPFFKRNGGQTPPMALTVEGVWKRERERWWVVVVVGWGGACRSTDSMAIHTRESKQTLHH